MCKNKNSENNVIKYTYTIIGTISELTSSSKEIAFKICGSEGYSIIHDKERYNVLFIEDINSITVNHPCSAFIVHQQIDFFCEKIDSSLLSTALANGKRVRISGETTEDEIQNGKIKVKTITLLSK